MAEQRLRTPQKIIKERTLKNYDRLFKSWELGMTEEVPEKEVNKIIHRTPHYTIQTLKRQPFVRSSKPAVKRDNVFLGEWA